MRVRLIDSPGGADALGAVAVLIRSAGRRLVRRARTDGSYASARDPRLLFGLGDEARPASLLVRWRGGEWERFDALAPDREHAVTRGRGRPPREPPA
jgi:hypothetical protein